MTRSSMLAASALPLFLLAGCHHMPGHHHHHGDTAAIEAQLRSAETQWVADWAAHDINRIVAHYAADGTLMAPGMARMTGADQIRAGATHLVQDPNFELRFTADKVDVAASGDLAYTRGTYSIRATDPATHQAATETGSYVTTYRRQDDDSWKAVDDISSPGAPAAAPAAAPAH